jgi:uncharacterized membrane protein
MATDEVHDDKRERGRQLDRVNSFSDGVFTIAATLLVLSIDLPKGPYDDLGDQLPNLVEPTFAYFLSFAVIGRFWLRHHQLFGRLRYSDPRFATLNLVFLSFIALLPAPTELLGRYTGLTAPVVIYAVNLIVLSAMLRVLYNDATDRGLTDVEAGEEAEHGRQTGRWIVGVFLVSIPVAFIEPRVAVYMWLLAAIGPRVAQIVRDRRAGAAAG